VTSPVPLQVEVPPPAAVSAAGAPVTTEAIRADAPLREATLAYLLAIGDDEMLLGHRDAEWTGLGPILEEDIAFSSMAQDEMGHALVWYTLAGTLGAPEADALAFLRDTTGWRSARLVELPRGDYAFSLVRQVLFDLAEAVRLHGLARSTWVPMAHAATKLSQEEKYHLLHGRAYLERLGRASEDSRARLQAALDEAFGYALGLWEPPPDEARLVAAGITPPSADLAGAWLAAAVPFLQACELAPPVTGGPDLWLPTVEAVVGGRTGDHGDDLALLLASMQGMYRSDPEATW